MVRWNICVTSRMCRCGLHASSYRRSRFGVDWLNWLQRKYAHGHWTLTVDPDEFLVYPFCDTRPLRALTDWLDASSIKSFSAMLLDMYPKGGWMSSPIIRVRIRLRLPHGLTVAIIRWRAITRSQTCGFRVARARACSLQESRQKRLRLNKVPLVKWDRKYVYVSSTHMLLPRGLESGLR